VAGLLLFKPQLLLGFGVWALLDIRRKWPCALGVLVMGIILFSVSGNILPMAWTKFFETFNKNLKFDSFEQHKMHNPLAFARLLFPADVVAKRVHGDDPKAHEKDGDETPFEKTMREVRRAHNVIAIVIGLAAIAVFAWLYWRRGDDLPVMFGGAVFLTLIAGPHVLIYEWMLLAIPGLLWIREWGDRPNTWFVLYACAWGVLFFCTDLNGIILTWVPMTVQWSVPVLLGVGWYAVVLLSKPRKSPASA
jgi:hypothetical protein